MLKNFSWLTAGNVLAKPLWLGFVTVVCIRILGAEGYGAFTAVLFLASIAQSLVSLGFKSLTIREVARRPRHAARYLSNFLLLKLLLGVVAFCGGLVAGWMLGYRNEKLIALVWAGAYTVALSLSEYCRALYRAHEQMQYEAASVITEKLLVVGIGSLFILYFRSAHAALAGMAVGMALALFLNLFWVISRFAPFRTRLLSKNFVSASLPAAIPIGLASQFVVVYFYIDAVMIDAMVGEAATGQYGAAYRLIQASLIITTMVTAVLYPRLSNLFQDKGSVKFLRALSRSTAAAVGTGFLLLLLFAVFAEPLMLLIKGDTSFAPAARALALLAWALPFMALNGVLSTTMNATDDQRVLALALGLAAAFNVLLNFALIPRLSLYGACVATLLTEIAVAAMLALRFYVRTYPEVVNAN